MIEAAERSSSSIVILGDFTPKMFHPVWFKSMGLLGQTEVEHTTKDQSLVIVDEFARFDIGAFEFYIARERFQLTTQREDYYSPLRDLVVGTITALEHSPAKSVGLNWNLHFPTPSEKHWHSAGDKLVPKGLWKKLWTKHIGMQNLQVRMERDDNFKGNINITIQPSAVVRYGVYVDINDHFEFKEEEDFTLLKIADVVSEQWEASYARAKKFFKGIQEEVAPSAS